ncbi:MAG: hypothetical protein KDA75_07470, partial [Planctomycetaceae bacterium]|nr:hypothetical protein [Planctomycetaceae bacterium]
NSTLVTSIDGDIGITGQGGGTGTGDHGVVIADQAVVRSTGTTADAATIRIEGTSTTNAAGSGNGVRIENDALAEVAASGLGGIDIIGRDGANGDDAAIVIDDSIVRTDTTQITITGVNQDVVMSQTVGTAEVQSNSGSALIQSSRNVLLGIVNLDLDADGVIRGTAVIVADADTTGLTDGEASDCVGEIVDNLAGEGANITAAAAALSAGTGIGDFTYDGSTTEEDRDIDVEVDTLAAFTCEGDIFVSDPTALTVGTVDLTVVGLTGTLVGIEVQGNGIGGPGDILIRSAGTLTVNSRVLQSSDGSTTLASTGANLDVNANITNSGGNARLVAQSSLNVNGTSVISTGGGDAELHAGRIFHFDETLSVGAADVDLTLATDTQLNTGGGDAILTATDDVLVSRVTATAATVYIVADSDNSGAGAIADNRVGEGAGNVNVTAANASLRAASGIGAADAIDTDLTNVAALTDHGDIKVDDISALTVNTIAGRAFSLGLTTGSFGETSTGDIASLSNVRISDDSGLAADAQDSGVDFIGLQADGAIIVATGNVVENLDAGDIALDANAGGVILSGAVSTRNDGGVFTGAVRISSRGEVTQSVDGAITADTLGVRTTSGQINLLTAQNDVNNLALATANANVGFRDADGFHLSQVTAQSNTMFDDSSLFSETNGITAGAGTVRLTNDGLGTAAGENDLTQDADFGGVIAASLGISFTGGDILMDLVTPGGLAFNDVDVLAIFAEESGAGLGGSIEFSDIDDLTIGTVSTLDNFTGFSGLDATNNILVCTGESLTITEAISTRSTTTATANPTDIVRLQAGTMISQTAGGRITTADLGLIAAGNINLSVAHNDVDVLAAQGANIQFLDVDDLAIGSVSADGCFAGVTGVTATNFTLCVGGDFAIGNLINVAQTFRLRASGNVTQTAAITATNLGIEVATNNSITLAGANNVNTFAASTEGGSITFNDVDDLVIDRVTASDCFSNTIVGVTVPSNSITITTGGNLTIDNAATGPVAASVNADRAGTNVATAVVNLTSGGAIIDGSSSLNGDGEVDIIGHTVTLTAQTGIGTGGGALGNASDLEINATVLMASNNISGNIQLFEVDNVQVATITNANRLVVLEAVGEIADATPASDATANIVAARLALRAGTGIGNTVATPAADLDLTVSELSAATADGDIHLSNSIDLTITTVGGQSGITDGGANDAILINGSSDITVLQPVTNAGIGRSTINSDRNLDIQAAVTSGGGEINLLADQNVSFGPTGDVASNGGDVNVTADLDGTGGAGAGAIVMADVAGDSSTIDAGSGRITITATNDVTIGGVTTTNGGPTAVRITATEGALIDGGDTVTEITAENPGAIVTLSAATGIGVGNALETSIAHLVAEVTGTGGLEINEVDGSGLELQDVATANGSITVVSIGTILATLVDSSATQNNVNDVTLLTTSTAGADILVTQIRAGAINDVSLTATDDITNTAEAGTASIIADDLVLKAANAANDGTTAIDLQTRVQDLAADVTGPNRGDIRIVEVDDLNLATADTNSDDRMVSTTNGAIAITTGGDLTVLDGSGGNDDALRTSDVEIISRGSAGGIVFVVGGDFELGPHAQMDAYNAALTPPPSSPTTVLQGSIVTTNDPIVDVTAQGDAQWGEFAQVRTLQSGTGTVVSVARQIAPRPNFGPPPTGSETAFYDASSVLSPTLTREGSSFVARLTLVIGQPGETGLSITLDWGTFADDRFETVTGLSGGTEYTFVHEFTEQEITDGFIRRSAASDDVVVQWSISQEGSHVERASTVTSADGAITIEPDRAASGMDFGLDVVTTTDLDFTLIPDLPTTDGTFVENGEARFTVPSLEFGLPQFNEEVEIPSFEPQAAVALPENLVATGIVTLENEQQLVLQVLGRDEYLELRVLSPDPDAAPLAVRRLPDEFLGGKEGASFTDLFNGLPDGTYEIWYVLGANKVRLVRVEVRDGKAEVQQDELDGGKLKLEEVIDHLREQLTDEAAAAQAAPATTRHETAEVHVEAVSDAEVLAALRPQLLEAQTVPSISSGQVELE